MNLSKRKSLHKELEIVQEVWQRKPAAEGVWPQGRVGALQYDIGHRVLLKLAGIFGRVYKMMLQLLEG